MPAPQSAKYEIVLKPSSSWISLELAGIWHYRDLLQLLVWRDFASRYKQTILGPIWFIAQPLLMTLVFTIVFGHVAGLSTDGLPPTLFYLCGQLGWNYFAANFNANSSTLVMNAQLFSKVYFPRLVMPLSALISNLFAFAIQVLTFLAFYVYYKLAFPAASFGMTPYALLLPLVVVHAAIISLGVTLAMSALTAKYRDLIHVSPLIIQVWMYATPIIVPLSKFPLKWQWMVVLNPMTVVVESFRLTLLGHGTVHLSHLVYSVAVSLVLLIVGLLAFGKVEKTFVDTV